MGKEFIAVELVWQSLGVPCPGPASLRYAEGLGVRVPVVPGLITGFHHRLWSNAIREKG